MAAPSPVRRNEVIGVLSLATDFAIGQPLGYGLRSAVASVGLARSMGLGETVATEAYYHGLLRYCGCTAETDKLNALFGDEIAIRKDFSAIDPADGPEFVRVLMAHVGPARTEHPPLGHGDENFMNVVGQIVGVFSAHCEVAARVGARLGLPENIRRNLGQLYERWDGHGFPNHIAGEAIAPAVRIVLIVQDALALLDIMPMPRVRQVIAGRSGGPYDPAVVDAFLPIMEPLLAPVSDERAWAAAMAFDNRRGCCPVGGRDRCGQRSHRRFHRPEVSAHRRAFARGCGAGGRCGQGGEDVRSEPRRNTSCRPVA